MNGRDVLINSKLFSEKYIVEDKIKTKTYKKGQFISDFFDGEYYVGVIISGKVSVYCVSSDGNEINMSLLKNGDVFGISNLFEEEALETILKCNTNSTAIFYPKKNFIEMLKLDRSIAINYSQCCNRKIQFLLKKIEFLNIQSNKKKIIEYLLYNKGKDNIVLLDCSKEELSKKINVSRASLYRELQALQNEKCLLFNKNSIQILDKEKLIKILYEI